MIPIISYIKSWFTRCKHEEIRCIHGDEIWNTSRGWYTPTIARVRCLICGKALYGVPLPDICTFTRRPHWM